MENLTTFPPDINTHWSVIAPLLTIRNDEEYEQATERLNDLIDEIVDLQSLIDEHQQIVDAFMLCDGKTAGRLLHQHLEAALKIG